MQLSILFETHFFMFVIYISIWQNYWFSVDKYRHIWTTATLPLEQSSLAWQRDRRNVLWSSNILPSQPSSHHMQLLYSTPSLPSSHYMHLLFLITIMCNYYAPSLLSSHHMQLLYTFPPFLSLYAAPLHYSHHMQLLCTIPPFLPSYAIIMHLSSLPPIIMQLLCTFLPFHPLLNMQLVCPSPPLFLPL